LAPLDEWGTLIKKRGEKLELEDEKVGNAQKSGENLSKSGERLIYTHKSDVYIV
jgi:hypothetical protein